MSLEARRVMYFPYVFSTLHPKPCTHIRMCVYMYVYICIDVYIHIYSYTCIGSQLWQLRLGSLSVPQVVKLSSTSIEAAASS